MNGKGRVCRVCTAMFVVVSILAVAPWAAQHARSEASDPERFGGRASERVEDAEAELRLREGVELSDELGEFHVAGERIRFRLQDRNIKLTVLENLALERVARVLEETRSPHLWRVSGTVTEYRGGNFLLITRAVVKAKAVSEQ